jgi:hypothetical protein
MTIEVSRRTSHMRQAAGDDGTGFGWLCGDHGPGLSAVARRARPAAAGTARVRPEQPRRAG